MKKDIKQSLIDSDGGSQSESDDQAETGKHNHNYRPPTEALQALLNLQKEEGVEAMEAEVSGCDCSENGRGGPNLLNERKASIPQAKLVGL